MKLLLTGICGFAGNALARSLLEHRENLEILGIDNLSRPGSETNLEPLRSLGCKIQVADLRSPQTLREMPRVDWLLDAAANPSVLAGVLPDSAPADLLETNLTSTIPMLELCRKQRIPFTLLSTSRVYGLHALQQIPLELHQDAFRPAPGHSPDFSSGIPETFPQDPPLSLYGTSKRCSEMLALEYGTSFEFPVWINRCGVLAGPGQFGKADQGIFSYWIHRWERRMPLKYIGFGGQGWQVRDCLNPEDLTPLLLRQFDAGLAPEKSRILNLSGSIESAISLRQLSQWCEERLGTHSVDPSPESRPFDVPWIVLDPSLARTEWNWIPATPPLALLEQIALHAEANPHWLALCGAA
jgi:CDP-paratose 2-epimerase